jgi:hypothetical protein
MDMFTDRKPKVTTRQASKKERVSHKSLMYIAQEQKYQNNCEAHNKIVKLCSLCTSIFCNWYLQPYHCDELDPELAFLQTLVLI